MTSSLVLSKRNSSKCSANSKLIKKSKYKNSNGRGNKTLIAHERNKSVEIVNFFPTYKQRVRGKSEYNLKNARK